MHAGKETEAAHKSEAVLVFVGSQSRVVNSNAYRAKERSGGHMNADVEEGTEGPAPPSLPSFSPELPGISHFFKRYGTSGILYKIFHCYNLGS